MYFTFANYERKFFLCNFAPIQFRAIMINIFIRATAMAVFALTALLASPTSSQNISLEAYELKASNLVTQKEEVQLIVAKIVAKEDSRAQTLKKFLSANASPMANEADNFVTIADTYNLDWKLLPAIAGVESTFGRFIPNGSYNAYGWNNGKYYFKNWLDATNSVAMGIKTKWGGRGKISHWKIGPYYAQNPLWASRVDRFMKLIETQR